MIRVTTSASRPLTIAQRCGMSTDQFLSVKRHWCAGHDTYEIAQALKLPECVVERARHLWREEGRRP